MVREEPLNEPESQDHPPWYFLTNYGHVLAFVAGAPDARIVDIARGVGITERAVQRIISELVEKGYLERHKTGRRNRYELVRGARFRHPLLSDREVGSVLSTLLPG
jgi:predicted transcriptional regulator